jgi:hypothetical protein
MGKVGINDEGMADFEKNLEAVFAEAQAAAEAAPHGERADTFVAVLHSAGLKGDLPELRKQFGED